MKKLLIIPLIVLLFLFSGCDKAEMPYGVSVKDGVGFFTFNGTLSSSYLPEALKYFSARNIKKVIMEIHSGGGSTYEMWRIISWIEEYSDIEYETRTYGMAGSASLLIFLAGDRRLISRYPTFMWHKTQGYFSKAILELFDGRSNAYFASRTGLTIDEIRAKIEDGEKDKDWYFGAKEAIALGIAHGYIE
ncbi:hypothetical protein LCGC14_1398510 [marine sediment metagenome]|uniref:ATP-dependent Clp protease proteolytic subunit n=1 Tax=marine sediment metagenome TaxID=412755 RepID=A0A0F9MDC9_9ZZZZ|nr:hypothetical protein [Desulfobacterales bacterium]